MAANATDSPSLLARMKEYVHVFVYGTLKPRAANFDNYCGDKVVARYPAYIVGDLYHLPRLGYPGAIHGTRQVHGFVLIFNDATVLAELDELEDYDSHRQPQENDYNRELVTAYPIDGNPTISAWAYLMTPSQIKKLRGVLLPDGWWEG